MRSEDMLSKYLSDSSIVTRELILSTEKSFNVTILSWNITKQCGSFASGGYNNGFGATETGDQYHSRLEEIFSLLQGEVNSRERLLGIIALQEFDLKNQEVYESFTKPFENVGYKIFRGSQGTLTMVHESLSPSADTEQGNYGEGVGEVHTIKLFEGRISIANVHLKSRRRRDELEAVKTIISIAEQNDIVLGDFNLLLNKDKNDGINTSVVYDSSSNAPSLKYKDSKEGRYISGIFTKPEILTRSDEESKVKSTGPAFANLFRYNEEGIIVRDESLTELPAFSHELQEQVSTDPANSNKPEAGSEGDLEGFLEKWKERCYAAHSRRFDEFCFSNPIDALDFLKDVHEKFGFPRGQDKPAQKPIQNSMGCKVTGEIYAQGKNLADLLLEGGGKSLDNIKGEQEQCNQIISDNIKNTNPVAYENFTSFNKVEMTRILFCSAQAAQKAAEEIKEKSGIGGIFEKGNGGFSIEIKTEFFEAHLKARGVYEGIEGLSTEEFNDLEGIQINQLREILKNSFNKEVETSSVEMPRAKREESLSQCAAP